MFALLSSRFWSWEMSWFRKRRSGEKEAHFHQWTLGMSTTWFISCFSTSVCFLGTLATTGRRWETREPPEVTGTTTRVSVPRGPTVQINKKGSLRGPYPVWASQWSQPSTLEDLSSLVQDSQNDNGRRYQVQKMAWKRLGYWEWERNMIQYYILTRQTNKRQTGPGQGETTGTAQCQPSDYILSWVRTLSWRGVGRQGWCVNTWSIGANVQDLALGSTDVVILHHGEGHSLDVNGILCPGLQSMQ